MPFSSRRLLRLALLGPLAWALTAPAQGREPATTRSVESSRGPSASRRLYYQRTWGIDVVGVRPSASGYMLRFDYRVVDARLAEPLLDQHARPFLIDEATRTALAVPAMENVGELRQVGSAQPRRTYFMLFGNPGRLVRPGSRVTVVIGNFRAEGLVVGGDSPGPTATTLVTSASGVKR